MIPAARQKRIFIRLTARSITTAHERYSASPPFIISGTIIDIMIATGIPDRAALKRGVILNLLAINIPEALVMYVAIPIPRMVRKLIFVIGYPSCYSTCYPAGEYVPFTFDKLICERGKNYSS